MSFLIPQFFFRCRPHSIDKNGVRKEKQNEEGEFGHNLPLEIMSKALNRTSNLN